MPRLREIPKSEVTSEVVLQFYKALFGDRDPVAEPGTSTGTRGDWWTVFANSVDIFDHSVKGFAIYRGDRKLDPVLRELGRAGVAARVERHIGFARHVAQRAGGSAG